MLAPISWLKEYVDINLPLKELMWRLTEIGLTCENYQQTDSEIILDLEVTPNRPDWLSIIGVAREISAIENKQLKLPKLPDIPKPSANLPIRIKVDSQLSGRYTGITVAGLKVQPSPQWLAKRLKLVGLRPINNLVDITNYVMFEMGIPIHVFDYYKFLTANLAMRFSKEGEKFSSVDGIDYDLPAGALIIEDKDRIIDLCGIKGGLNTGVDNSTKNIFIHIPIYNPELIRKASQALKLASEASYIYERGANAGGTLEALRRAVDLTLQLAGGKIASAVIDLKKESFESRKLTLSLENLNDVLGITIPYKQVLDILNRLYLSPKLSGKVISCAIPTYRGDLLIEEDLIEEIARLYGYNTFPRTLPRGAVQKIKVAYFYNRGIEMELKNLFKASGFFEQITLSLIPEELIKNSQLNLSDHIKISNPVSKEAEFMRRTLIPSLLLSIKLNKENDKAKLFEYGKVYLGEPDKTQEPYKIAAVIKNGTYEEIKGVFDLIIERLNIDGFELKPSILTKGLWHPTKSAVVETKNDLLGTIGEVHSQILENFGICGRVVGFELDVQKLLALARNKIFKSIPLYPAQVEDISLTFPKRTLKGEVLQSISQEHFVSRVEIIDIYKDSLTFRLYYQHPTKTLTNEEVEVIRTNLLNTIQKEFGGELKN